MLTNYVFATLNVAALPALRIISIIAVRTLSPRDPALQALAALPVRVPFHSIIGQHNAAPIEESSDGVVPYSSARLHRATGELVVRSGPASAKTLTRSAKWCASFGSSFNIARA